MSGVEAEDAICMSPFVSTDFELRRVAWVLHCKEVINIPSVSFGLVEDARLLDKQSL